MTDEVLMNERLVVPKFGIETNYEGILWMVGIGRVNIFSSFVWQIYAVNKRSYETARHILVIKVIPGMYDSNVITYS